MAETKRYSGGCHCGAVRYEVTTDLAQVATCNCSICTKGGTMLSFVGEESFKLLSGQDSLTQYNFNRNVIDHLFCKTCGIRSFARGRTPDGNAMVAINVRCLDDVDLGSIETLQYDGRSL